MPWHVGWFRGCAGPLHLGERKPTGVAQRVLHRIQVWGGSCGTATARSRPCLRRRGASHAAGCTRDGGRCWPGGDVPLEQAIAGLWAGRPGADGLSGGTRRSQLLCLTAYVDEDVAARAAYLSAALSHACHYHPDELSPTASELTRWLNETAGLLPLLQS
jgi:hypothetical protein